MTRLRKTIALRLKESQNTAAQLTTFNEVDMTTSWRCAAEYKDSFEKKHGVRLGFMGFFVKAVHRGAEGTAQRQCRDRRRQHRLQELLRHRRRGLDRARPGRAGGARRRSAVAGRHREGDHAISALRARDNKLKLEELQGGTFSITNGGVFGSLMSTPILNSPQSGILGMHKIQPRPMAIDDKVEIRPMMYLALSYDHRLVDGREAVTFLVRVKENLEDPQRLLLDI